MPDPTPRRAWAGLAACAIAACAAPSPSGAPPAITIVDGYDWSVPPGVGPRPGTGLYSEEVAPARGVEAGILDLTWRQLEPLPGVIRRDVIGHAEGFDFGSWIDQRRDGGRYWLRLWMTDVDDAPAWVGAQCAVLGAPPLEEPCVWERARAFLRRVLLDEGVLADPDFVLLYVPRAFSWSARDARPVLDAPSLDAVPAPEHLGPDDHADVNDDASYDDTAAAHHLANLTALAGGPSWRYVEGGDRDLVTHGAHWRWVRAELGRTADDAFDGWVAIFSDGDRARFLTRRGLVFDVDPRWLSGEHDVEVAVTFTDGDCGTWRLAYAGARGLAAADPVACTNTGAIRTARLRLPDARFTGTADLAIDGKVDVRMLRVVRR